MVALTNETAPVGDELKRPVPKTVAVSCVGLLAVVGYARYVVVGLRPLTLSDDVEEVLVA